MIYQLKIILDYSKPPIWRRVLIPADFNLVQLHQVIQISMGWENCHLHEFTIKGKRYAQKFDKEFEMYLQEVLDASKFKIKDLVKEKNIFSYCYDFGDNWDHKIIVEKAIEDSEFTVPFCIKTVGACPPEDCGGIQGFYYNLEVLANKKHPEYQELKEWMDEMCYKEEVDIAAINQELQMFFNKPKAKKEA